LLPFETKLRWKKDDRGLGMFKDKIRLPPDWCTQKERRQSTEEVMKLMGIDD
jgi:hypothetical protein